VARPPPQSFLLRLWRDQPDTPWRATVVLVTQPQAPHHFATLDALFTFLLAQTDPAAVPVGAARMAELDTADCTSEDWSSQMEASQGETL
jgi:hypothetical protein